jgi:hypothetical protein
MREQKSKLVSTGNQIVRSVSLVLVFLLCACAEPARYIVISEDVKDVRWEHTGQRFICLSKEDARNTPDLLALYTKSDIQKYEERRKDVGDPVAGVLYHLIRADYHAANDLLHKHEDRIPAYVRTMLKADLAYENAEDNVPPDKVVKLYQDAFELQPCDIGRTIIQLRIRQLRYRR